jgi:hypothetical protein
MKQLTSNFAYFSSQFKDSDVLSFYCGTDITFLSKLYGFLLSRYDDNHEHQCTQRVL